MVYFLKKSNPSKKGLYLQIYQTNYIPGKGKRNKSYKSLGYVCDLQDQGIEDPIAHAKKLIYELNQTIEKKQDTQIGDTSVTKNLGCFLLKSILDE
ncbi:MAG: transposase, partial [Bacilli bacterium]